ncbi:type 2 periplasmic-binding domain-containing protein [Algoriphagus taiwanensis]|uniref:Substrate-binding domain-containing protein n=1 Tax=Algoriphagus taiwanensis TaxID=1445656 RepID=A0ABQ6PZ39_9BACT|nr:substrate-binding domain-containing protein [Algoriphagus taiwanensis]
MKTYRIVGVPEHFNFPFRLLAQRQPLKSEGITIEWTEESKGSGQMSKYLREGEVEMAILLTESFFKEVQDGNPILMAGFHVLSPLVWGIHVKPDLEAESISEIHNPHFLVSRMGSGSHLMAKVLAESAKWDSKSLTFEQIGNMDGAKEAFSKGNEGMFLWEKYTTAPEVKKHAMKRMGEVKSPWPCFVMVVSKKSLDEFPGIAQKVRDGIYSLIREVLAMEKVSQVLSEEYHLDQNDVDSWLVQTEWCQKPEISQSQMESIQDRLVHFDILDKKIPLGEFLLGDGISLRR